MMSDTLWRTISRSAPAIVTPEVNASLIVQSRPYRTKATKMESSVSIVRDFFRFRLLQTKAKNFIGEKSERGLVSFHRLSAELAFVQIYRSRRAGRGVRIVGDHDDGFPMLTVQGLQQIENFVAGLPVQIAGRLVAQQQGRIGHNRAGNADPLLFTARECARIMRHPVPQPNDRQRRLDMLFPLALG